MHCHIVVESAGFFQASALCRCYSSVLLLFWLPISEVGMVLNLAIAQCQMSALHVFDLGKRPHTCVDYTVILGVPILPFLGPTF